MYSQILIRQIVPSVSSLDRPYSCNNNSTFSSRSQVRMPMITRLIALKSESRRQSGPVGVVAVKERTKVLAPPVALEEALEETETELDMGLLRYRMKQATPNKFRKRKLTVDPVFDRKILDSVFSEWMKAAADLPLGIKSAYDSGLLSSAELTRFLSFDNPETTTMRGLGLVFRSLPGGLSNICYGKILADPALPQKVMLEMVATIASALWSEFETRCGKDLNNFKENFGRALGSAAVMSLNNAFIVCLLASNCAVVSNEFDPLQKGLNTLSNHLLDRSNKFKQFDLQKRVLSFFNKGLGIFLFGLLAKAAKLKLLGSPSPNSSAVVLDHGISAALKSNLRYQVLCGLDKMLLDYFDVSHVSLLFSFAARISNAVIGTQLAVAKEHGSLHGLGMQIAQLDNVASSWKNAVISNIAALLDSSKCDGSNLSTKPQLVGRAK